MAHAWKACWVQALGGSNPPFSAQDRSHRPPGTGREYVATRSAGIDRSCHRAGVRRFRGDLVATSGDGQGAVLRLRPRRSLLGSGILGLILVPLPIVVTILALGSPDGSWLFALVFGAITVILLFIGLYLFQTTYILITARQVTEREFFGAPVSTPRSWPIPSEPRLAIPCPN